MKKSTTLYIARIGMMTALSFALMFVKVPYFPPFSFFQFDLANVPVLITALSLGPLSGVLVAFLRCALYLPIDLGKTGGAGILSNFILATVFAVVAGSLYMFFKGRKGAALALGTGSVVTIGVACLSNWFLIFPLFKLVMGFDVKAAFGGYAIYGGVLPFNAIYTSVIALLTFFVYKTCSRYIMKGDTILGIHRKASAAPAQAAEAQSTPAQAENPASTVDADQATRAGD